jgi:carbamoyl-phosphate synthase large subunit
VYVLEVNPRASRTVPYLSKVTGLPMVKLATRCALGMSLDSQGFCSGVWDPSAAKVSEFGLNDAIASPPNPGFYAVKAPVFSFQKLTLVEPSLGPEMKSTGEVMGIDYEYPSALLKAMLGAGIRFPERGTALITVCDADKDRAAEIAKRLFEAGFDILATSGTHKHLHSQGLKSKKVARISESKNTILSSVRSGMVSLLINTPSADRTAEREAMLIRRSCVEIGIPCLTSIDTAEAFVIALAAERDKARVNCQALDEYFPHVRDINTQIASPIPVKS